MNSYHSNGNYWQYDENSDIVSTGGRTTAREESGNNFQKLESAISVKSKQLIEAQGVIDGLFEQLNEYKLQLDSRENHINAQANEIIRLHQERDAAVSCYEADLEGKSREILVLKVAIESYKFEIQQLNEHEEDLSVKAAGAHHEDGLSQAQKETKLTENEDAFSVCDQKSKASCTSQDDAKDISIRNALAFQLETEEIKELRQELATKVKELKTCKTRLKKSTEELSKLTKKSQEEIESAKKMIESKDEALKKFSEESKAEIERYRLRIKLQEKASDEALEESRTEIEKYKKEIRDKNKEIDEFEKVSRKDIESYKKAFHVKQEELDLVKEKARTDIEAYKKEISCKQEALETVSQKWQAEITAYQTEIECNKKELGELVRKSQEEEERYDRDIRIKKEELETLSTKLRSETEQHSKEAKDYKQKIESYKKEFETVLKQSQMDKSLFKDIQNKEEELNLVIKKYQEECEKYQAEIQTYQEDIKNYQRQIQVHEQQNDPSSSDKEYIFVEESHEFSDEVRNGIMAENLLSLVSLSSKQEIVMQNMSFLY